METLAGMSKSSDRNRGACGAEEVNHIKGQARLVQVELGRVQQELSDLAGLGGTINDMLEAVHQLELVSDGIQQSVMNVRMLPIGPLLNRFRRVIRDITHANGKDIALEIKGEKTELDKRMIDESSDPLVHLVANAADHGIEPPDVREAAGKPRQGTVTSMPSIAATASSSRSATMAKGSTSSGSAANASRKAFSPRPTPRSLPASRSTR